MLNMKKCSDVTLPRLIVVVKLIMLNIEGVCLVEKRN